MRIIVVGAGIGGLAAARALSLKGFSVLVLESAATFRPTAGAGFGFSPNGQICLNYLGLGPQLAPTLHPLHNHLLLGVDHRGPPLVHSTGLKALHRRYGIGLSGSLRADLVDVLLASLPPGTVHFGRRVAAVTQDAKRVTVTLTDGGVEHADLVVGADGIHSTVALNSFPEAAADKPIFSGENIFYGVIDKALPPGTFANHHLGQPRTLVQSFSAGGEFLTMPLGGSTQKLMWAQTYRAPEPPAKRSEWDEGATHASEFDAYIRGHCPATSHAVHELRAATDPSRLLHFGLFFRKHKARWHAGRVCLLGDACHATLPYVGQGANQAIEDACVLAECLGEHRAEANPEGALAAYYSARYKRTKKVVDSARGLGAFMHAEGALVSWLRDRVLVAMLKDRGLQGEGSLFLKVASKEIIENCPVPFTPVPIHID